MGNILLATEMLIQLLSQAQGIGQLLRNAREHGRDISDEELNGLTAGDDAARAHLDALIKAKREGDLI